MKINRLIWTCIYFGIIGIIAYKLLMWITPYGSGISPDSTTYMEAAKSLIAGKGFSISANPITHYPPLYPVFLAAAGLLEDDLIQASRFLNALIFGINAGVVALAVYLVTKRNFLASTFAAFFFLSSAQLLEVHAWAWSEPLFITFSLVSIILLSIYAVRPTVLLLVTSALILGFSVVTRYIGVAYLPAALVIVFMAGDDHQVGQRFRNTLAWLIMALMPLAILFARNVLLGGSATNRHLIFHPMPVYQYGDRVVSTITNLFAPGLLLTGVKLLIFGLLAVLLTAPLLILLRYRRGTTEWRRMDLLMTAICLLFTFSYILFLLISISFFDAATSVDLRLLSPILAILVAGIFSAMWAVSQTLKQPVISWSLLFLIFLSIWIKTPETVQRAADIQNKGLGYTARRWQRSESLAFVRSITNNVTIYSNGVDVIGLLTDKEALSIPYKRDSTTLIANIHYEQEIEAMCKDLVENRALLVYFPEFYWRRNLPSQAEIQSTCPLPIAQQFKDGTVYRAEQQ